MFEGTDSVFNISTAGFCSSVGSSTAPARNAGSIPVRGPTVEFFAAADGQV